MIVNEHRQINIEYEIHIRLDYISNEKMQVQY